MTIEQWLGEDNQLGIDIWKRKYQYKNETFDQWLDRVSGGNTRLRNLIKDKKFLFGGRALSNRGTKDKTSLFNCYSSGFCEDDFVKIMELNTNLGLTYKAQGGQGVSLSKLRPKGTAIGDRYVSDGIVPFIELFNQTTASVSQGGSRKGALMISLDVWHKEAEDFITLKRTNDAISKANLSLEIDDKFMEAVRYYYKTGEELVFHEKKEYEGHMVEYDVIPIKLYKKLIENCYNWAEPGCIFTNRFRNYNLMEFVDEYQIETCNPCGEQPLPKDFSCNLGSLNLYEFVKNKFTEDAYIDYNELEEAIYISIEALDTILDENLDRHALKSQAENSKNYRNVGLGLLGYADALMALKLTYGSLLAKTWTEDLFRFMLKTALKASYKLAKEKGHFPKYNEKLFKATILQDLFSKHEIEEMQTVGLRNCSLLSIAPTGSISTMLGRSGGCEPEFAIRYQRKTESLVNNEEKWYDVYCLTAQEFMNKYNVTELPEYFVSSADITWKDRVDTQAIMQKYVDTAISSTVNLPEETSIEDVEQLYLYAWQKGLKGITIYRTNSGRSAVLTTSHTKDDLKNEEVIYNTIIPTSRKTIGTTHGNTYCKKCACGTLYITLNRDDNGNIVESFINTSKGGICQANIGAINRMISVGLRSGVKVDEIIDQLKGITCPACTKLISKGEQLSGISCPDILARTLQEEYEGKEVTTPIKKSKKRLLENTESKVAVTKCPDCGELVIHDGGCITCTNCGWSKCS